MKIDDIPFSWARKEVEFSGEIRSGGRGRSVFMIQEWLHYHGFPTSIDGRFGPATELSVRDFQEANNVNITGSVDEATHAALVQPLLRALEPIDSADLSLPDLVLAYGRQHVALHPIELGGANAGPWVRLYMEGNQGEAWAWCAGFVTFLMKQACAFSSFQLPIPGSPSCDSLAAQAKKAGRFVHEKDLRTGFPATACIFLVRRTPTDWVHVGLVAKFDDAAIRTIEGNTNDSGSREGFEAIERSRGTSLKDYITLQ